MVAVNFKHIENKGQLSTDECQYILNNLHEWLPVMSLTYRPDGSISVITIYTENFTRCITISVDANKPIYEVIYDE